MARLTLFLVLLGAAQVFALDSYSQVTKLTLKFHQAELEKVLDEIEEKSEFFFLYNKDLIDVEQKVDVEAENKMISEILDEILEGKNIQYYVFDRQIVLSNQLENKNFGNNVVVAQQPAVAGIVTDETGLPLPGVTVLIKGTTQGTVTNADGEYSLNNIPEDAILQFSFVGMQTQEIEVGNQTTIDVTMVVDAIGIEEVVAIGYGTEIRRNLTSSVATVKTENLAAIPSTSLSNAIAGRAPGVLVTTVGGRPGTTSSITIRGATNAGFNGNSSPLYVIDNIIATKELFDLLDVNEVEDISFLKDAAASAIYGSRASNGVVLVTTKSGKTGKAQIQFTSSLGTTELFRKAEYTTAYEHSLLINQSIKAGNTDPIIPGSLAGTIPIPQNELDFLRENPYPSHADVMLKSGMVQRYAANVSGGTDVVDYFIAGSYVDEEGILPNLNYSKVNVRAKVGVQLSKDLRVSLNTDLSSDDDFQFYWPFDPENLFDSFRQAERRGNWAPTYINGLPVANQNAFNVADFAENLGVGSRTRTTTASNYTFNLDYQVPFIKGLSAGITYNKRTVANNNTTHRKPAVAYVFAADPNNRFKLTDEVVGIRTGLYGGADGNSVFKETEKVETYQLNTRVNYERGFNDHNIKALFVYEQWEYSRDFFNALRRNLLSHDVPQLFATSTDAEDRFANGSQAESGRLSYIGSLGYSFKNKYFLNGTFRVDGSTEFLEGNRYGIFPSVSAAWVMSEEQFFGDGMGFIDFMKMRVSYGRTGNDNLTGSVLPSFAYLIGFQQAGSVVFGDGNTNLNTIRSRGIPNVNLTWDKTDSYNVGFDFAFFANRLSTSLEYFKNYRFDLFGPRLQNIPALIGAALPPENYGAIEVGGIDLSANYKNNIGKLAYNVGVNVGYAKDKVTEVDESEALRPYQRQLGHRTDRIFGYTALGIIRTQEQLDQLTASGYTFNNQQPYLGSLYFEDLRGNPADDPQGNTPDGKIDANDRSYIGNARPPVNYGISLSLNYGAFALDAFVQGLEGHQKLYPDNSRFYFDVTSEGGWAIWNDAFEPDTNPDGSMPRFVQWGALGNPSYEPSTFWMKNAGFARLKNLNLAYQLPVTLTKRAGIDGAKLFFNGTNLFMIYSKIKDFDPELRGTGIPLTKSYSLGVQITL